MTDTPVITALIADDEDTVRAQLVRALKAVWPGIRTLEAVNGADAWDAALEHAPTLCFLDVRMPGLTGLDVARRIGAAAHLVFVAAPTDPALQALAAAGVDHLRKPVTEEAVAALRTALAPRLADAPPDLSTLLARLAGQMRRPAPLEVIRTGIGRETEDVRTDDIAYFETEGRHTRVVRREAVGLIRTPVKDLVGQLDGTAFVQIARHVLVNRRFIAEFDDTSPGGLELALAGRPERLTVAGRFQTSVQGDLPR